MNMIDGYTEEEDSDQLRADEECGVCDDCAGTDTGYCYCGAVHTMPGYTPSTEAAMLARMRELNGTLRAQAAQRNARRAAFRGIGVLRRHVIERAVVFYWWGAYQMRQCADSGEGRKRDRAAFEAWRSESERGEVRRCGDASASPPP
jgi:hypothetical protein